MQQLKILNTKVRLNDNLFSICQQRVARSTFEANLPLSGKDVIFAQVFATQKVLIPTSHRAKGIIILEVEATRKVAQEKKSKKLEITKIGLGDKENETIFH